MAQQDIYDSVTNRIIQALESGTPPWRRPWMTRDCGLPRNAATSRQYNGVNVWLLLMTGQANGYDSGLWGTFNQWKGLDAYVCKGEKATKIVFFNKVREAVLNEKTGKEEEKDRFFMREYSVFNAAQCGGSGVDRLRRPASTASPFIDFTPAEELIASTMADIRHGGNAAFYNIDGDFIQLPEKSSFTGESNYYSTAMHELAHWSGHESRLNRLNKLARFGDKSYSMEELVAELGAAYLTASLNIPNTAAEGQSASYLSHWVAVLKSDRTAIFTASSAAAAASNYVLGCNNAADQPAEEEAIAA